jgi:S-formylglutathione hydrolase
MPLCLVLHGGGTDREFLVGQKPIFDAMWEAGELPPMLLACASTGELSFYLEDPEGKLRWESFLLESFLTHLRATYPVRKDAAGSVISGASMGGYGSLKLAFRHPDRFSAVAALEPAIEPALRSGDGRPRNRFFYPAGGVDDLIGPNRNAALWEANNPATILVSNADTVRDSGLSIYLEAGDRDLMNLHDGAEFLHRVLWDQQIPHEYHLVKDADHVGPSFVQRTREAFSWLGRQLTKPWSGDADSISETARAWIEWLDRGFTGHVPPPLDMSTPEAITVLREQFSQARTQAAEVDPTTKLHFGKLPEPHWD